MLTEEYLKNHFITAYYIDNDRKMIEIQCRNDDDHKIIPYVIEQDPNTHTPQTLMKFISEEELLNITHDRKNRKKTIRKTSY